VRVPEESLTVSRASRTIAHKLGTFHIGGSAAPQEAVGILSGSPRDQPMTHNEVVEFERLVHLALTRTST
jgi:hypothetical protein